MSPNTKTEVLKESRTPSPPWLEWGCLCLSVFVAYASVWPNEFVFDDKSLIVQNALWSHWDTISHFTASARAAFGDTAGAYYRPVPAVLYFLVYQVFGLSTVAFHALSLALHALNACLLYSFGIRTGFKKGVSFAAALLWAVHPLHTEAVAYMSSTSELLWATFCLSGLIVMLPDMPQGSGANQQPNSFTLQNLGLMLVFFLLALCSKGSAVIFPALAVAALFFVSKGRATFSIYLKTWPLWLLAVGYAIAWTTFVHMTGFSMDQTGDHARFLNYTSSITNRTITAMATLPIYAELIIWPEGLHFERNFSVITTLLQWRPMVGTLIAGLSFTEIIRVWLYISRNPKGIVPQYDLALSFGLIWFAAALFPATGIAYTINALIAERWMYVPTMGLFLCMTQIAADLLEKKKSVAQLLVLVLAFSLSIKTFFQSEVWRNPETLYYNIAQNGGIQYRIMGHLGNFYLENRQFDKAIDLARFEISHPVADIAELKAEPHMLLALALLQFQPDIDDRFSSTDNINKCVRASPHVQEVMNELEQVIQLDPDNILAHQYLAAIYNYQGNNQLADFHDTKAKEILQQQKIYAQQHIPHTGLLYLSWGEFDKAIEQLQYEADHTEGLSKILKAEIHLKLAMAWLHVLPDKNGITFTLDLNAVQSSPHIPEAIAELEKATQINPDFYFAHAVLAFLYKQQGNMQMADIHQKHADNLQKQNGH